MVCDTNTVISAFLWGGTPRRLLDQSSNKGKLRLFSSPVMLAELRRVLSYPKFEERIALSGLTPERLFFDYWAMVAHVQPASVPSLVPRDPDDNHVVAAALTAHADAIVSGDADLLSLGEIEGLPVLKAAEALALFA